MSLRVVNDLGDVAFLFILSHLRAALFLMELPKPSDFAESQADCFRRHIDFVCTLPRYELRWRGIRGLGHEADPQIGKNAPEGTGALRESPEARSASARGLR